MIIEAGKYSGPCTCGRSHEMLTKLVVIQPGCLKDFDRFLDEASLFGKRAAVYDKNTCHANGLIHLRVDQEIILDPENLHADEKSTESVLTALDPDIKVLIAVGSGTIHDIARYCANKLDIAFVACPTAASMDGICSTVSAMTWNGFKKTLPGAAPSIVLADIDVIKEAPVHLALSGVGDIFGKYTALADWRIANLLTGEFICPVIEELTRQAVVAVYSCCHQLDKKDPQAFEQLTYGLILSGLAMQMMGNSRPASGAEHHISHFIEMEPAGLPIHATALHGEKVGVGTILVSGIYHRLAEISDIASRLRPYPPITEAYLKDVFKERLTPSVLEENIDDCGAAVTPELLIEHWQEICDIIAQIPVSSEFEALYQAIGAKSVLEDILVDSALLPTILEYSPCVRNRLTLMRIRRMIQD